MDKILGPGYSGDPGVPHIDLSVIFGGTLFVSINTLIFPYHWQYPHMFNWHDLAMVRENHERKRARKRKDEPAFVWNDIMKKTQRQAYTHNWLACFP